MNEWREEGAYPEEVPKYTEIKFSIEEFWSEYTVPKDCLFKVGSEQVELMFKERAKESIMLIAYSIACLGKDKITYPENWWQAFKARWFPRFLLKRYPVVYETLYPTTYFPELEYCNKGMETFYCSFIRRDNPHINEFPKCLACNKRISHLIPIKSSIGKIDRLCENCYEEYRSIETGYGNRRQFSGK